ncbi:host cell division inhibitor Icd-like protein [Klebsiella pneumoniae]
MIAHKTKASMPGRLSHNALLKHRQITRLAAGGQTLCVSITDLQINCVRLAYGHHNPLKLLQTVNLHSAQNSLKPLSQLNYREMREPANPWIISTSTNGGGWSNPLNRLDYNDSLELDKSLIIPKTCDAGSMMPFLNHEENQQSPVLDDDANPQHLKNRHAADLQDAGHESDLVYERVVPHSHQVNRIAKRYADSQNSLRGEPLHNSLRVMQNSPFLRGAVHSITGSNPVQLSDSDLAFLRCLRLISPFAAVIRNPAVLSPSSFSFSISSKSSRGSLTESCKERLFFLPVAITETSYIRWCSVYTGKLRIKHLKWCSLGYTLVVFTLSTAKAQVRHKMAKPRGASTPSGLLTTNVSVDNEAAMKDHTTHPQGRNNYIWRFLALSAIGRNVIHITAATEREAREQSPAGCVMVFAGRLPVEDSHA